MELMTTVFWIVHNLVAHPLLLTGTGWAQAFHDWTAGHAFAGPQVDSNSGDPET